MNASIPITEAPNLPIRQIPQMPIESRHIPNRCTIGEEKYGGDLGLKEAHRYAKEMLAVRRLWWIQQGGE